MVCRALSASEGCGLVVVIGVWFVVCVWLGGCGCPLGLVACVCGCSCGFCVLVFVCFVLVVCLLFCPLCGLCVFLFLGVFFGFGFVVFSCAVSCVLMDFRLPS